MQVISPPIWWPSARSGWPWTWKPSRSQAARKPRSATARPRKTKNMVLDEAAACTRRAAREVPIAPCGRARLAGDAAGVGGGKVVADPPGGIAVEENLNREAPGRSAVRIDIQGRRVAPTVFIKEGFRFYFFF